MPMGKTVQRWFGYNWWIVRWVTKFTDWKDSFDANGLQVNMSKTKILVSNPLAECPVDPNKYPCGVCKKEVSNNSIFCHYCKSWIHHHCSNIKSRLSHPNSKCQKYCQERKITPAPQLKHVDNGNNKLGCQIFLLPRRCYLQIGWLLQCNISDLLGKSFMD